MPIEIKELIIKTTISEDEGSKASPSQDSSEWTSRIVRECVDQVMQILNDKEKR